MAKARPEKVNPSMASVAVATGKDLSAMYSECVRISFQTTGRFSPGFDAKDFVAYIQENFPGVFDAKGKRVKNA